MNAENFSFSRKKFSTLKCCSNKKYARCTKFFTLHVSIGIGLKYVPFANEVFADLEFHIYRFAGYEQNKDHDEKNKIQVKFVQSFKFRSIVVAKV